MPVGDDQGRAVLDLQDHAGADAHAAQQAAADLRFHQGVGADAAGDGGRHVVQGVGIRLELVQADGRDDRRNREERKETIQPTASARPSRMPVTASPVPRWRV